MKYLLTIVLIISVLSCNDRSQIKVNSPKGNKILYWEFTGPQSKRLVLYSLDEQKEYEIHLDNIDGFPDIAVFSPDGNKILIKDPHNSDGIHIFDLVNSKWNSKFLPPLNYPGEGDYFYFGYINDSTAIFKGLYNLFIISLNTTKLIDQIAFNDTFFVTGVAVVPESDKMFLEYSDAGGLIKDKVFKVIQYNYKTHRYNNYYKNTGFLYQKIPDTDYLFMWKSKAVKFNYKTGKIERINFDDFDNYSIILPSSRFIDSERMIILKQEDKKYRNNFYFYNTSNNTLIQITKTKTEKTLMDIYFKQE